jgi:hypothetical protein
MRAQTQRADADDAHVRACTAKLDRLLAQRQDLMSCFDLLLTEARDGRAYFKLYRQFKMYNTPALNPCSSDSPIRPHAGTALTAWRGAGQ